MKQVQNITINRKNLTKALVVGAGETVNLETVSVYNKPHQRGKVLVKAVVLDGGSLNLKGMIKIKKGAEGVEAFLRQNILLVGEGSKAMAVPELEIESNEVKASHAAAVGKIDKEQLFYLRSRGIGLKRAEKLIMISFLKEAMVGMKKDERKKILGAI